MIPRVLYMNVLVTGGTGFLGKHMVVALLDRGCDVTILVRSPSRVDIAPHSNLTIWEGDITEPHSISGIAKNVDVIYHFAAQVGEWGLPDDLFYSINVKGTGNLLDECLTNPDSRFIFISTPGVQGKGYKRAKESFPYNPPYIYEKTKCEAEKLVVTYNNFYGLPMAIIRPDFVYGPGDYRRIPLYRTVLRKRFLIIGSGKAILHPTYVDDVVLGLLNIGKQQTAVNDIFNIAGPEQLSVEQYVGIMARVMGVSTHRFKIPLLIGKAAAAICEKMAVISGRPPFVSSSKIEFLTHDHGSDISKAEKILGVVPRYDFESGFRKTYDWAQKNNLL